MPNPLKAKIKQTFVLNMYIETVLFLIQKRFDPTWQIESSEINSDTITFRATREGVEVLGRLERWQGTESRLHLDGEVLSKVPYENWREWTGMGTFIALFAIWVLVSVLPLTAIAFENIYFMMSKSGNLLLILFMLSVLAIFLGIPFLFHRYFTKLSPDIRLYEESLAHLTNFVSELKTLQNAQELDTSRLEEAGEAIDLANTHEKADTIKQSNSL